MKKGKLTIVSTWHYFRLVYRSVLFLVLLALYIVYRVHNGANITYRLEKQPAIMLAIWIVFMVEMLSRLFPSGIESPGSQKQFARNYLKSGRTDIVIQDNNATVLVALIWISFNAVFGALYMTGLFDDGIMMLISCAYSVCDMICILFFCPFQTWFLKNKCCSACRIYNWDYAMMFTPLFFVKRWYAWSLLVMSVILLFRWEITFYRYPERFSESTNDYLKCANCTEKLCAHKKQLHRLWEDVAELTAEKMKKLKKV